MRVFVVELQGCDFGMVWGVFYKRETAEEVAGRLKKEWPRDDAVIREWEIDGVEVK